MRPLFGPRTVVEAAFLVAVPVIALEVGVSWYAIVAAGAAAYVLVLVFETVLWQRSKRALPPPPPEPLTEEVVARPPEHARVVRAEPDPRPVSVLESEPQPMAGVAAPEAPSVVPVPEPVAAAPVPEPELPAGAAVVPIGVAPGPRQWNIRDLEQLASEHAGGDPIADEERTFLLKYLRDFVGPDGMLPPDFDELVRQSFGGIVANP
jgi:hypothetical protein